MKKTKKISDIERIQNILKDESHFDSNILYDYLDTFQLWGWEGGMLTAQLKREDVIKGLEEKRFFIITGQAVGQLPLLNLNS